MRKIGKLAKKMTHWCNCFGEYFGFILLNWIFAYPCNLKFPLLGICPKEIPTCEPQVAYITMFKELFLAAKTVNNPKCPYLRKWMNNMVWSHSGILHNSEMKWLTTTHNNTDFIQHNAKWQQVPNDLLEYYALRI